MSDFDQLPEAIRRHLEALVNELDIRPVEDARQRVASNWNEKHTLYEEQTGALAMIAVDRLAPDDPRGALLLTYSGSLVAIGPAGVDGRAFEYASIAARTDVPDLLAGEAVALAGDLAVGRIAEFTGAPITQSSDLFAIATFPEGVSPDDQSERLRQAMIFLTNGFVEANRSLTIDGGPYPDRFTMREIVRTVASRNGTTQAIARSVIEDYLASVETGVLLGKRVSLGKIGRLELTVRSARKARIGRNPATGEEMLIPSQSAKPVPRMSFSSATKERAAHVPLARVTGEDGEGDALPG
jgi:nucleoid DNA-binding protein